MRAAIDGAGRLVVPKPIRDELGLTAGTELELIAVDGHLEASIPSRVTVDKGPNRPRFVADTTQHARRRPGPGAARARPVLTVDTSAVVAALSAWHERPELAAGVSGGSTYDGLVALQAHAQRQTLLTLDERAEPTYRRLGIEFTPLAG